MITLQEAMEIVDEINCQMHNVDDHSDYYNLNIQANEIVTTIELCDCTLWDSENDPVDTKEEAKKLVLQELNTLFEAFALHHKGLKENSNA